MTAHSRMSSRTGDLTPPRARNVGRDSWMVSYLPGRTVTRAKALAAPPAAEVAPTPPDSVGALNDAGPMAAVAAHRSTWGGSRAPTRQRGIGATHRVGIA
ncbi:hypothetical protein AB0B25_01450 [Nocardia sp. NPDC049190]|uniref:hypothetical protein n=1 Tax=Nocardia sp. NPDC049190 TaxID=3155650 RepID=UPI0033E4853F